MADGAWSRQGVNLYPWSSDSILKRPRTEYEPLPSGMVSGHGMHNYLRQDTNQIAHGVVAGTDTIGSAYDRYLQSTQVSSFASRYASNAGEAGLGRGVGSGMSGMPLEESVQRSLLRQFGSDVMQNGQGVGVGGIPADMMSWRGNKATMSLPHDASKTLYVEGLSHDATRREVAHIFRPFVGYKEVRLAFKEAKLRGDPMIMCFVDFVNPACAATAMSALQGYEMDEHSPDSDVLHIQFSRYGPRSSTSRGRR